MDGETLKRLILGQMKMQNVATTIADGLVDDAITLALPFVWEQYTWRFKRKEKSLTLTASQEYVELPADFGSFYSLRLRDGSSDGWKLRYFEEDSFELYYPNPEMVSEGDPRSVKIVRDQNKWRAYFFPIPNGSNSLTLIYGINSNGAMADQLGNAMSNLLVNAVWIFVWAPGTEQYAGAKRAFNDALINAIDELDDVHTDKIDNVRAARRFAEDESFEGDVDTYWSTDWQ